MARGAFGGHMAAKGGPRRCRCPGTSHLQGSPGWEFTDLSALELDSYEPVSAVMAALGTPSPAPGSLWELAARRAARRRGRQLSGRHHRRYCRPRRRARAAAAADRPRHRASSSTSAPGSSSRRAPTPRSGSSSSRRATASSTLSPNSKSVTTPACVTSAVRDFPRTPGSSVPRTPPSAATRGWTGWRSASAHAPGTC